jgi:hypothetical protein
MFGLDGFPVFIVTRTPAFLAGPCASMSITRRMAKSRLPYRGDRTLYWFTDLAAADRYVDGSGLRGTADLIRLDNVDDALDFLGMHDFARVVVNASSGAAASVQSYDDFLDAFRDAVEDAHAPAKP